jgi:hypothetical protein
VVARQAKVVVTSRSAPRVARGVARALAQPNLQHEQSVAEERTAHTLHPPPPTAAAATAAATAVAAARRPKLSGGQHRVRGSWAFEWHAAGIGGLGRAARPDHIRPIGPGAIPRPSSSA